MVGRELFDQLLLLPGCTVSMLMELRLDTRYSDIQFKDVQAMSYMFHEMPIPLTNVLAFKKKYF